MCRVNLFFCVIACQFLVIHGEEDEDKDDGGGTYLYAFGCDLVAAKVGRNIFRTWDTGSPGCACGHASSKPASRRTPWNSADTGELSCLAEICNEIWIEFITCVMIN